jgi:hypothetical protein
MTHWLWNELRDRFGTDDGSLPEVRVDYCDSAAVVSGYALLRRCAARVVRPDGYHGSKTHEVECPKDTVSSAAARVVAGEAEAFHVVLGGIRWGNVVIPDLGVFVFQEQLVLDYRMGPAWGPKELDAFFALLRELVSLEPGASLSLEEAVPARVATRFHDAWRRWSAEHVA